MNCDQFAERMHQCLDRRRSLNQDGDLVEHARGCQACAGQLEAWGRIAAVMCYDIWFPELFRLAAVQGADVLCVPTNWVPMPEQPKNQPKMANVLGMAGAHASSMYVGCADRIGS